MDTITPIQVPLRFTTIGDPSLPSVVFLHGFLGSGSDWLPFTSGLSGSLHCILVDLPGHGGAVFRDNGPDGLQEESEASSGYFLHTVDTLAEGLRKLLPAPGFLVGYSMGGRIGVALLLRHPELFQRAVIVSSSPGLRTEEERLARRKSDEGTARKIERNFEGFLEFWYSQPLFSTLKSHPLFHEVETLRQKGSPRSLARALRLLGTGNQPSFWDQCAASPVPVQFMAGEKDPKYLEIGRQMVNLFPHSRLETFPGCGHTLHIEARDRFQERLQHFFNQQD
ncbi:2-succinyl-6-hydroxy-2,4-cyclohexadiene-1-carboxylate synthase [Pelodictyon luteolum]|nr:2-succinyl-6-hydroxy-2,4-cyclohexadiene-1-carboxylate synthase [Pelodictyon luteolum]